MVRSTPSTVALLSLSGRLMTSAGDTLPPFSLSNHKDELVTQEDVLGTPTVFFFYPKANTPGCTTEACAFRDRKPQFDALGVRLIGVSADTVRRQSNFVNKYQLTMELLSDPDHQLLDPWGIWAEKKNYGRTYMGIKRTTVWVDANGVVQKVWENVRVKNHAESVLQEISSSSARKIS